MPGRVWAGVGRTTPKLKAETYISAHQNGVSQQPSHEHGAEATAPCDRLVMVLDRIFACDVALDDSTRGMRSVAVSGRAIEELCQLLLRVSRRRCCALR